MKQIEFFEIPSPCINVCQSGPKGYCLGCFRSREERTHWHDLGDDVKRKIVKACVMRKRRAAKAKNKRATDDADTPQLDLWRDPDNG